MCWRSYLPHLGKIEDIHNIIKDKNVEEVIIAIEYTEHDMINLIINKLINVDVEIKAIPSMYDILTGRVQDEFHTGHSADLGFAQPDAGLAGKHEDFSGLFHCLFGTDHHLAT